MRSSFRPWGKASCCYQYQKQSMEPASKSFRAVLPNVDETQLEKLRCWTQLSCAAGLAFREGNHVVLIATRERARTKEAFMRSLRGTLGRLGIAPNAQKGRWLVLTSEAAVDEETKARNGREGPSGATLTAKRTDAVDEAAQATADDRLIELPSAKRSASTRVTQA